MSKQAVLGVDVGGTKTLCLLVNNRWQIVAESKFKTAGGEGCDVFSRNLLKELKALAERAQKQRLELVGIGVGCAGTVDRKHGIIKTSLNLLCLEGFPVRRLLQRALKLPVVLDNDVQLGILAEHRLGAGKDCDHILGVFFGTGVGGAMILNGSLYPRRLRCGRAGGSDPGPAGGRTRSRAKSWHSRPHRQQSRHCLRSSGHGDKGLGSIPAQKRWRPIYPK